MEPTPISPTEDTRQTEPRRRRASLLLIAVVVLFVLVPFLFWRGTWFGRPLTDLDQGMLNVARVLVVGEIFRQLFVAERTAEPGPAPEQKRNQDKRHHDSDQ